MNMSAKFTVSGLLICMYPIVKAFLLVCAQVGPQTSVLGQNARANGFTQSLVARLHKWYKRKDLKKAAEPYQAVMLTNHRSHPSILCLPNSLFYDCSLQVSIQLYNR